MRTTVAAHITYCASIEDYDLFESRPVSNLEEISGEIVGGLRAGQVLPGDGDLKIFVSDPSFNYLTLGGVDGPVCRGQNMVGCHEVCCFP